MANTRLRTVRLDRAANDHVTLAGSWDVAAVVDRGDELLAVLTSPTSKAADGWSGRPGGDQDAH